MGEWSLIADLARRNFWRQRRRNASLLLAVAIGMAATLAGGFLIRGWQMSTLEETVERFGGSVLIHHPEWVANPKTEFSIPLDSNTINRLEATTLPWLDRIVATVTLQSERETRGATLLGIDAQRELADTALKRLRYDGDFLQDEQRGIVIGAALADDLETRLGKRLVLLGLTSEGKRAEIGLRIVGIYHANSEAAERGSVYVAKSLAQDTFGLDGRTSEIALAAPDLLDTQAEVSALQAQLPQAAVRDWRAVEPGIWAMYKLVEGMVVIWQMVFLGALAFGLVNTLVAAVLERTREFGLLLAVGMKPRSILQQVLVESWLILFVGLLLGGLVAAIIYFLLAGGIDVSQFTGGMEVPGMNRPLYPVVLPADIISLVVIVLLFGFLASIYPAPSRGRTRPRRRPEQTLSELNTEPEAEDPMNIVRCTGLSRYYNEGAMEVRALDNVDLSIDAGEFVSIAGPSGSGKSTLLNMLGALDSPTSGQIWIQGELINGLSKAELADVRLRRLGFVFQSYNLIPVLSAEENVEFVLQLQGVAAAERSQRARSMLERVGLQGLEDRRPAEMSGGQQQRVAIARALASEPDLLLADEPSANLDSQTTAELMTLLTELNESLGTTIVMVTHDNEVMSYAKRQIRMRDGQIVSDKRTPRAVA